LSSDKIVIKKVSPFITYTTFNDSDIDAPNKSKCYDFTLQINNANEREVLDSLFAFIRLKYKNDFDTIRPVLSFTFWKYEKGKVDENFIETQTDRSLSNTGKLLYSLDWERGEFIYVQKFNGDGSSTLIDSLGNELSKNNATLELLDK
jgi:hypothetical protein